jgi:tetratricopeptide (TPR) repeat protein
MNPKRLPADRSLAVWLLFGLLAWLGGCSTVVPGPSATALLHDELFAPSQEDVAPERVLALSDAMRDYANRELRVSGHRDPRRALIEALQQQGNLHLAYDATRTGNAAETYAARSGNCLALVLMTGAFARHLGLDVTYRNVGLDPQYTRAGGLTLENGHVNLLMAHRGQRPIWGANDLIVDFLPDSVLSAQRAEVLEERTVLAMYMNNRAAETLTEGRLDDAYAWARAAALQDPAFGAAANTLAVVYMRRGALPAAEAALRHALARDADNTAALSNLVSVLRLRGRQDEAATVAAHLARVQPYPPFHYFELGRRALEDGKVAEARQLFARELRRQPYQHEVHFWAAQASWRLGDMNDAAEHLRQAADYSTTLASQKLYAGKLDYLRALRLQ